MPHLNGHHHALTLPNVACLRGLKVMSNKIQIRQPQVHSEQNNFERENKWNDSHMQKPSCLIPPQPVCIQRSLCWSAGRHKGTWRYLWQAQNGHHNVPVLLSVWLGSWWCALAFRACLSISLKTLKAISNNIMSTPNGLTTIIICDRTSQLKWVLSWAENGPCVAEQGWWLGLVLPYYSGDRCPLKSCLAWYLCGWSFLCAHIQFCWSSAKTKIDTQRHTFKTPHL